MPHKLLKKYEKMKGKKVEQFVECLGEMAVERPGEQSDFFEYTKEWIRKVNRGGLFPLNDATYQLFIAIEREVQTILPQYIHSHTQTKSREGFQTRVVDKVCSCDDVQWHWTILSACIESEDDAVELLREIVQLCVTIRGFSMAASYLELYKSEKRETTKKSHGLRKELARSDSNEQ